MGGEQNRNPLCVHACECMGGASFITRSMMHFNGCMHMSLTDNKNSNNTRHLHFIKVFTLSSPLGVSNWLLHLLSDTHITGRYCMSLRYMTCTGYVYSCLHILNQIFIYFFPSLSFSHSCLDLHYDMD